MNIIDKQTRDETKKILGNYLKVKSNITIFENCIHTRSNNNLNLYNKLLYSIIYDILSQKKLKSIIDNLSNNKFGWNNNCFDEIKTSIKEQDNFLENPPEIDEGVFECSKCHGKRTFSFEKQTRSGDEAGTVFVQCYDCGKKWTM